MHATAPRVSCIVSLGNPVVSPRCPHCGAYDAWEDDVYVVQVGEGLEAWEYTCGVCRQTWLVPLPPTLWV